MARTVRPLNSTQPWFGRRGISTHATVIGIACAVVVMAICVTILQVWRTGPTYDINPDSLLLTQADVGEFLMVDATGSVGSAQRTVEPLPYQQQMIGGRVRIFIAKSVESAAGLLAINGWLAKYGAPTSNPPTIMGPFVADHSGIFELDDVARTFRTIDAAKQEFHCCQYPDRARNFTNFHTLKIYLGNEADAWTGVNRPLSGPGIAPDMPQSDVYQERGFVLHWRHGPVVSNLAIWGAHDIMLGQALSFAHIVDARIAQAMQRHQVKVNDDAHVDFRSSSRSSGRVPSNTPASLVLWASDRRSDCGLCRNRSSTICQCSQRYACS